jgi:DNA-binding MarR family transcriptional regulator
MTAREGKPPGAPPPREGEPPGAPPPREGERPGAPPPRDGVDRMIEQWARERPELDVSPIGVIGRISRLSRELEARLEPVYRAHGLEPGWHDVLATLRRSGPPYRLRATEFTRTLMITSSGATKRLDRLERAGLIERSPNPQDRRGTLIGLTPAGRELIDGVTEAHLDNERRLLSALTADEQQTLADLLRTLQLGLPDHQTSPSRQSQVSSPDRSSSTPSTGST